MRMGKQCHFLHFTYSFRYKCDCILNSALGHKQMLWNGKPRFSYNSFGLGHYHFRRSFYGNGIKQSGLLTIEFDRKRSRYFSTNFVKSMAGHSHWANIKFKKMHKDAERSKKFGKLSLEIIQAVKEKGSDPMSNSKLDGIISRAKAAKMPKDSIESAIKSALRVGSEAQVQLTLEVRGPGRCGLLLDVLSTNVKRTRPELNTILKKYGGIQSEEGSVSFMFQHKGIVTVEGINDDAESKSKAEDAAILCGAEDFYFDTDEEGKIIIRFVCAPADFGAIQNSLSTDYGFVVNSANDEYIAIKLVDLDENQMTQADKLIDQLSSHPDVMRIFDNIRHYPSSTLKREEPL